MSGHFHLWYSGTLSKMIYTIEIDFDLFIAFERNGVRISHRNLLLGFYWLRTPLFYQDSGSFSIHFSDESKNIKNCSNYAVSSLFIDLSVNNSGLVSLVDYLPNNAPSHIPKNGQNRQSYVRWSM